MPIKDYYKTLGVDKTATQEAVKSRFRKLAKELHPDVNPGDKEAERKFTEVSEAYDVLGNAQNRKKYDQLIEQQRSGGFHTRSGAARGYAGEADDIDWDSILSTMFGWEGGSYAAGHGSTGRGADGYSQGFNFDGFRGFGDTGDLFGADGGQFASALDIENTIQVPLSEAFAGVEKTIRIAGKDQVKFKIQPGALPGERIRLDGLGKEDGKGRRGDRLLKLELTAESGVALDGIDIIVDRDITPWDAALGTTLPINVLGSEIGVKVKSGARSGMKLRVRGHGYRDRTGRRGDLIVKLSIQNPVNLPDEIKIAYEKAAGKK